MNEYFPQSIPHPSETLVEKLNELGMGSKEFAIRTGKPEKTISAVLNGNCSITSEMSIIFENVLKIPAGYWLENQRKYDEYNARVNREVIIEGAYEWARSFPYAEMAKYGWIRATQNVREKVNYLFNFFSLSSKQAWENYYLEQKLKLSFRVSLKHSKEPYAISAWLRQGEIASNNLKVDNYDSKKFEANLLRIRELMVKQPTEFFNILQQYCAEGGVKIVYTPCLPKAPISGSSRWINKNPIIQLSARYHKNDHFWFTFFHEAGHILLHGKKYISLENIDFHDVENDKEKEADEFAMNWLFKSEHAQEVIDSLPLNDAKLMYFSEKFNTPPAVIVGRLQHDKFISYKYGRKYFLPINLDDYPSA